LAAIGVIAVIANVLPTGLEEFRTVCDDAASCTGQQFLTPADVTALERAGLRSTPSPG
jgi:hypothetical protein